MGWICYVEWIRWTSLVTKCRMNLVCRSCTELTGSKSCSYTHSPTPLWLMQRSQRWRVRKTSVQVNGWQRKTKFWSERRLQWRRLLETKPHQPTNKQMKTGVCVDVVVTSDPWTVTPAWQKSPQLGSDWQRTGQDGCAAVCGCKSGAFLFRKKADSAPAECVSCMTIILSVQWKQDVCVANKC